MSCVWNFGLLCFVMFWEGAFNVRMGLENRSFSAILRVITDVHCNWVGFKERGTMFIVSRFTL